MCHYICCRTDYCTVGVHELLVWDYDVIHSYCDFLCNHSDSGWKETVVKSWLVREKALWLVVSQAILGATISFLYAKSSTLHCIPDHSLVAAALDAGVPLSPETLRHQLQLQLLIAGAEAIGQSGQELVEPSEGFLLHRISETTNEESNMFSKI